MQTCCTIITKSHLPYAKVLYQSLQVTLPGMPLQVLVIDEKQGWKDDNFIVRGSDELRSYFLFDQIEKKYAYTNTDLFRWALKPIFISYLLENGFEQVVYADPDLFFVNDFSLLFKELETSGVLLCPHWRDTDPLQYEENFFALFKDGLFNAGLIGFSSNGLAAVKWWASQCHYKMEKRKEFGLYDDQRYLDALPVIFDNVKILRHRGYNIACWNYNECKRSKQGAKILINGEFPLVCIHFTKETIREIKTGKDGLLSGYLDDYKMHLKNTGVENINGDIDLSTLNYYKNKIRLRTRLKSWLYRLAGKL